MATAIPANQINPQPGRSQQPGANSPYSVSNTTDNPWTTEPNQQSGAIGGASPAPSTNSAQTPPAGGFNLQWLQGLIGNQPWNQQTFNSLTPTFQQYGIQVTPPNAEGDQTKINIPGQGWVRVGFGEGQPVWIPQGDGGSGGGMFPGSPYSPWSADPREGGLFDMLMNRAKQGLNLDPKDPIIANQVNAYRAEQDRGARNYLKQQAEAGGPLQNMSMEGRMASEKASQATGSMQSQLMQNELNARRQEIQNALTQMGGMLTADQQLALQKELAYLSNDQFLRSLGLQAQGQAYNQHMQQSGAAG